MTFGSESLEADKDGTDQLRDMIQAYWAREYDEPPETWEND